MHHTLCAAAHAEFYVAAMTYSLIGMENTGDTREPLLLYAFLILENRGD
jgi:hypothetical protein